MHLGAAVNRIQTITEGLLVLNANLVVTYVNEEGRALLGGQDISEIVGKPFIEAANRESDASLDAAIHETMTSRRPMRMRARSDASGRYYEIGIYPSDHGGVTISYQNVTYQVLNEAVTRAQKNALELAISGESLEVILIFLSKTVEELAGSDVRMAILLAKDDHLELAAAPSLPADYCAVINGMKIAEGSGACGTAAFRGQHVITTDVETDPLWSNYREIALRENLRACWAAPVKGTNGEVIALFAIYYDHAWNPTAADQALVELVSHTTSLIVETYQQVAERRKAEAELLDEVAISEALNIVSNTLASELSLETVVQAITDAAVKVSEAEFGAFFYNVVNERRETYMLYSLSGAPREAFENFPMPSNTAIFEPTFRGTKIMRLQDVTQDELYGQSSYKGMPPGHLPVRSYLGVPVISRTGEVHGGLFLGHHEVGKFTFRHEQLVVGLAAQAAVAIDNRRLYEELHETARRLSLALSAAELGAWRWDAATDVVDLSSRAGEIFGVPHGPHMTWTELQGLLVDEDAIAASAAVLEAVEKKTLYDVEYRVRVNGGTTWVSAKGSAHYDSNNELIGMHGIVQDISERKALLDELNARAEALTDADRRKDEFLATLAHELRNPLAPIRSGLDLMKLRGDDPGTLSDVRGMMDRQVTQMVRIVDDLLDVSRITRGAMALQLDEVDVSAVIKSAVETAMPGILSKNHELTVKLPERMVMVQADSTRLAQVLSNLLNNAARYTPAGGSISITALEAGADVEIRVRDNGIGLDPGAKDLIFEMFAQGTGVSGRSPGGLGIGLTLAKRLVEMHGGTIEVESDGAGQGSEFTVRIPALTDGTAEDNAVPAEPEVDNGRLRVVVADDNEDAANLLRMMIASMGHDVRVGYDGEDALEQAAGFLPHVMILDIGMPRIDGYETARRIRAASGGEKTYLVALTGWGQPEDRRHTLEAGFDFHLTKPIEMAALRSVLERAAKGRDAQ